MISADYKILIDFDGDGICGYNGWTYSEQLDQGVYSKAGCTITPDAIVAPDGMTTADKIIENTDTAQDHFILRYWPTMTANTLQAFSLYAKAGTRRYLKVAYVDKANGGTSVLATVDLQDGGVDWGSGVTVISAGNGWYRIGAIFNSGTGANPGYGLIEMCNDSLAANYNGDGSYLYVWGLQIEPDTDAVHIYTKTVATACTSVNALLQDVTPYFISGRWSSGRDYAGMLVGRANAGSCNLEFRNRNGEFNAYNASSPFYGLILSGLMVQIRSNYHSIPRNEWTGFLNSIQPRLSLDGNHQASLYATGPLAWCVKNVSMAMQTAIGTGDAVDMVLDDAGWPAGLRAIDDGATTMNRWWTGGSVSALGALRDLEDTEFGYLHEDKSGNVVFEDRNHRAVDTRATISQAMFRDDASSTLKYCDIVPIDNIRQIANIVKATVTLYTVSGSAVMWTLAEAGSASPVIAPGLSRSWWTSMPVNVIAVDAWTTPAATTDLLANSNPLGGGTPLTTEIGIATTKLDVSMKITLTNNSDPPVPAYITFLQARGTAVVAADPIGVDSTSPASILKYGSREFPIKAKYLPSSLDAQAKCDLIRDQFKNPLPLLSITSIAASDDASMEESLARQISDKITIVATGKTKLGIYSEFWVESMSRAVTPDDDRISYQCQPAWVVVPSWLLGTSVLGTSTILSTRW
jgi:hypothetical protein